MFSESYTYTVLAEAASNESGPTHPLLITLMVIVTVAFLFYTLIWVPFEAATWEGLEGLVSRTVLVSVFWIVIMAHGDHVLTAFVIMFCYVAYTPVAYGLIIFFMKVSDARLERRNRKKQLSE